MKFKELLIPGFLLLASICSFGQNQLTADSLKAVLESQRDIPDKKLFDLVWDIADNETVPEERLEYSNRLLTLATQIDDEVRIGMAYELLHFSHRDLGNIEQANQFYLKAQALFQKLGRNDFLAAGYAQEASLLVIEGQYQQAVVEFKKSLQTYQKLQDTLMANYIRVNMGEAFRLFKRYDSASYYLKEAIANNFSQDELIESYASGNLGMAYSAQERYDSAKLLLEQSVGTLEALGDVYSVAVYTFELGKVLQSQGQQDRGESKMLEAYDNALANGLKEQGRNFSE